MSRVSAFRGTWEPNRRPYLSLTPDVWVAIQGETSVIACGECKRRLQVNRYVTGISTEGSVDSPPGTATINLSIPDTDVTEFYVENEFAIIPMMEVEIFAKGYYTVGGYPQYYRIFWGLVQTVSRSWSNGVTSITLNCVDILRWWQLTNVITNPAFLDIPKSTAGQYQLFGNMFAGSNPYTVIIMLAKEAMGDFSITTSSFTSFRPEDGAEQPVISQYAKDIMAYWQLKFGNMWNNLVLYGTSGRAYTFEGMPGNVNPLKISQSIFEQEAKELNLNPATAYFKIKPWEIAIFKRDYTKAGEVDFFQNDTMTKLEVALQARDQAGQYEFYCDTTGDIIFKPPFYNLNVIPNKPVSWIQDFEILDDSISDTEQQVYTHVVSHGNAFGGVDDYGVNDDITTPRTGVIDWHLLKRYGWRKWDLQVEWAGDPKKLFYHCLDALDRSNVKRISGNITIPMRPELRMGFPVWIPSHDAFYYVSGISHQYSVGGQATTSLTLIAKRSKFIAPKNIGKLETNRTTMTDLQRKYVATKKPENKKQPKKIEEINYGVRDANSEVSYSVSFPSNVGATSGLISEGGQQTEFGGPAVLRDPRTGKLLGFPNAVMVYRTSMSGQVLARLLEGKGDTKAKQPQKQDKKKNEGPNFTRDQIQGEVLRLVHGEQRSKLIERIRMHRYEWGFSNAGAYDYAHDEAGEVQELNIVPASSILWGTGTDGGPEIQQGILSQNAVVERSLQSNANLVSKQEEINAVETEIKSGNAELARIRKERQQFKQNKKSYAVEEEAARALREDELKEKLKLLNDRRNQLKAKATIEVQRGSIKMLPSPNVMVRPVSDEFGFEVIGHYRYGRGAFLSDGGIQIQNNNQTVNQLGIQFAAHGGLLTDSPRQRNLGPLSFNFSEAYEKMIPDDFMTGANFTGGNYQTEQEITDVNPTNQATYTSAIEKSARLGTTVFVEADALRRATTLAELRPYTNSGSEIWEAVSNCACQLGRTNWLSVLPQEAIQRILSPNQVMEEIADNNETNTRNSDSLVSPQRDNTAARATGVVAGAAELNGDNTVSSDTNDNTPAPVRAVDGTANTNTITISVTSAGQDYADHPPNQPGPGPNRSVFRGSNFSTDNFFSVLNKYLEDRFNQDYQENITREHAYTTRDVNLVSPHGKQHPNTLLSPRDIEGSGGSLFDRAASGDPNALRQIRQGANFNFGRTEKQAKEFNAAFRKGGEIDFHLKEAGRRMEETGQVLNDEWPNTIFGPGTTGTVRTVGQVIVPKYKDRQPQPERQINLILQEEFVVSAELDQIPDLPVNMIGSETTVPDPIIESSPAQPQEVQSPPSVPRIIESDLERSIPADGAAISDEE